MNRIGFLVGLVLLALLWVLLGDVVMIEGTVGVRLLRRCRAPPERVIRHHHHTRQKKKGSLTTELISGGSLPSTIA